MAKFSMFLYFTVLTSLLLSPLKGLTAYPSSSFSLQNFGKDPNFEANIGLYGDAKAVGNGSALQLTQSQSYSAGRVMYKKPIKLVEGKPHPENLASFSSYFSFSMSPENGDGLAFVMVPSGFNVTVFDNTPFGLYLESEKNNTRIVAVEFDTRRDVKYGDLNDNHVGIDVGGFVSVRMRNISSLNMVLNSGKVLHSWIDYEAGSKRLEVRLSQSGETKPVDPLLSHPIDLSKVWYDEGVFVGLSSSNGNSSQACYLHSWSFQLRHIPHWMHSQPLNPQAFAINVKPVVAHKRSGCLLRMLAAMVFGAACGALGALAVLYLWTIFGNRRPVVPEECSVHPLDIDYKKVKIVVDTAGKDSKQ
ncbi:hypothetical protein Tsubulata_012574 [Turnera subulata]|uniref:Legume lectin domain-containing protein n=1 Tax=Turnera subulata TaxID=218843 RepID=A0A9Q0FQT3_9ROSI|nr:hypothetical protein Tsubulata_012574 [Turnera subulata]